MEARYLDAFSQGILAERVERFTTILQECHLCPRRCRVNRIKGERGVCKTGANLMISSYGPHFGEEQPLVGVNGSGTIFMTNCNLMCVFCQNYEISHLGKGYPISPEILAGMMIDLQNDGCHNINFVTPSHVVPQILSALLIAVPAGLHIPLVYNCSGYEEVGTLKLLSGIIDIYMPDFKFWSSEVAEKYCNAPDYPEKARSAIKEMFSQVGDLVIEKNGIASQGLLIRHLVMPGDIAGTKEIVQFVAREISVDTYVNIMNQYRPCGEAFRFPEIARQVTFSEYQRAIDWAREAGLKRLA